MNRTTKRIMISLIGLMPTVLSSRRHGNRESMKVPTMDTQRQMRIKLAEALVVGDFPTTKEWMKKALFHNGNEKFKQEQKHPKCCFCGEGIPVPNTKRERNKRGLGKTRRRKLRQFMIHRTAMKVGQELLYLEAKSDEIFDQMQREKDIEMMSRWVLNSTLMLMKDGRYSCSCCARYLHKLYRSFIRQVIWSMHDVGQRCYEAVDGEFYPMAVHPIVIGKIPEDNDIEDQVVRENGIRGYQYPRVSMVVGNPDNAFDGEERFLCRYADGRVVSQK